MVKFMSKKGLCPLKTDTCHLHLQRLNHGRCNCWLSMPLIGVQGENQERGTLCSGKNWQNMPSDSYIFSGEDFMSPNSCIFSYLEKHWRHLSVKSALAVKEKFTITSQNRVAMVQISWEITRWCYGCTFRLDLVLLNTWVFWVMSGLDATILKTMSAGSK